MQKTTLTASLQICEFHFGGRAPPIAIVLVATVGGCSGTRGSVSGNQVRRIGI